MLRNETVDDVEDGVIEEGREGMACIVPCLPTLGLRSSCIVELARDGSRIILPREALTNRTMVHYGTGRIINERLTIGSTIVPWSWLFSLPNSAKE